MTRRQIVVLVLLAMIWGASFLFIKLALREVSPLMIAAVRVALAAAFLAAVSGFPRQGGLSTNFKPALWRSYGVMAVFNALIPYILIAWGEQRISSGLAAIFNATTPLFAFLIGFKLGGRDFRRTLGLTGVAGLVVGILGVGVLVGWASSGDLLGEAAVVVASASYAVAGSYARSVFQGQPVLVPAL
ncbi:MAG TPA: DMT family transporter [Chloroflexota bacterium]|nr:DMT family transporter [Chloroflexota bacterium]